MECYVSNCTNKASWWCITKVACTPEGKSRKEVCLCDIHMSEFQNFPDVKNCGKYLLPTGKTYYRASEIGAIGGIKIIKESPLK